MCTPSKKHKKILYLHCNPRVDTKMEGREHLRYQEYEFHILQKLSENLVFKKHVSITFVHTYNEAKRILHKESFWMVYFAGHGNVEGLHLLDQNKDASETVSYDKLFDLFGSLNPGARCLVMNACLTGGQASFKAAMRRRQDTVEYVIGTMRTISDAEGSWFSFLFFRFLLSDRNTISSAFDLALLELSKIPFSGARNGPHFYLSALHNIGTEPSPEDYYFAIN